MKVIKASYEILKPESPLKHIERIGRVCYKSEDKITEDGESAKKFVKMLLERNHGAMLEHYSMAFDVPSGVYDTIIKFNNLGDNDFMYNSPSGNMVKEHAYLRFSREYDAAGRDIRCIVSGNLRAWGIWFKGSGYPYEIAEIIKDETLGVLDFTGYCGDKKSNHTIRLITDYDNLQYEEKWIHQTVSVLFTVDRGVTHELVRHRPASFAQESTRYVRYNNENKEGTEMSFIDITNGIHIEGKKDLDLTKVLSEWTQAVTDAERHYNNMLEYGATPQIARSVLPNSIKSNITVTATIEEWKHILNLRALNMTGPAHPQMQEVMKPLYEEFKKIAPGMF